MALILNIDTATENASIALSRDAKVLGLLKNREIKDHASWLHQAVQDLLRQCGVSMSELQAIAVTAGPGSYTGLRVGMASAKGFCYVLNIPLITENTLKVMARAAIESNKSIKPPAFAPQPPESSESSKVSAGRQTSNLKTLLVPMIDARRMEVFTAIYDLELSAIMPPVAIVLNPGSFASVVSNGRPVCLAMAAGSFNPFPGQVNLNLSR